MTTTTIREPASRGNAPADCAGALVRVDDTRAIGPYQIIRRLAVGGMAEVYLARRPGVAGFNKLVALKRVRRQYADNPDYLRMFRDEVQILSRLSHPNIPQLIDMRSDGDALYCTMEYLHGLSLVQLRRLATRARIPIPLECAVSIICDAAAALHHAHTRTNADGHPMHIIHRDVTPANVLVGFEGQVKVIDFGVAKAARRETVTQGRLVKGSLGYMSPEQCLARPLDCRTDIFSLGIVLYELTTGVKAFTGLPYDILKRTTRSDLPRPTLVRPDYPPGLERIVVRALRRSLSRRYATMEQLHEELRHFASEQRLRLTTRSRAEFLSALLESHRDRRTMRADTTLPEPAATTVVESRSFVRAL